MRTKPNKRRKPVKAAKYRKLLSSAVQSTDTISSGKPSSLSSSANILANNKDRNEFWRTFMVALETEAREALPIQGASGVTHEPIAIGVDDLRKRVVVVSPYHDALTSAMMQSDVQATFPDAKILVVRPISLDLSHMVRSVFGVLGVSKLTSADINRVGTVDDATRQAWMNVHLTPIADQIRTALTGAKINLVSQFVNLTQQLALIGMQNTLGLNDLNIDLSKLLEYDAMKNDREFGICPLPLYRLPERDMAIFLEPNKVDEASTILRRMNISQYFFPPKDQLVLGGIDRGIAELSELERMLAIAGERGHLVVENEVLPLAAGRRGDLRELLEALVERKMLRQVEYTMEVTEDGRSQRLKVVLAPREALLSKLVNLARVVGPFFGSR